MLANTWEFLLYPKKADSGWPGVAQVLAIL